MSQVADTVVCGDLTNYDVIDLRCCIQVQEYFACRNFHPIYESTVYEGLCYEANRGLTWVAFTQILIVFFSMIMLMLRVAFMDVDESKNESTAKPRSCFSRPTCLKRRKSTNDEAIQDRGNEAFEIEHENKIAQEPDHAGVPDDTRIVDTD